MSPKFYWFLWLVYFVTAGVLWLGGVFSLTMLIAYGFVAFGLVFTGMMCVLPNVVSHPPVKRSKRPTRTATSHHPAKPVVAQIGNVPVPAVHSQM